MSSCARVGTRGRETSVASGTDFFFERTRAHRDLDFDEGDVGEASRNGRDARDGHVSQDVEVKLRLTQRQARYLEPGR